MQLSFLDRVARDANESASAGPFRHGGFSCLRRTELGRGAWLDYAPGWLEAPHRTFETLKGVADWQQHHRRMYERVVPVPRLVAALPGSLEALDWDATDVQVVPSTAPPQTIGNAAGGLVQLSRVLSERYQKNLCAVSLAYYRGGRDSVAFHGDKLGPVRADTVVAIVSVGGRRSFLLRPTGGGKSRAFNVGEGDLLVMGGTCQETFEHAVPKAAHATPRIAIMFRERATPRPATAGPGLRASLQQAASSTTSAANTWAAGRAI